MKFGSVTDGRIPLGFCNSNLKVDMLSKDSGTWPQISGSDSEIDACGLKNLKSYNVRCNVVFRCLSSFCCCSEAWFELELSFRDCCWDLVGRGGELAPSPLVAACEGDSMYSRSWVTMIQVVCFSVLNISIIMIDLVRSARDA